VTKQTTAAGNIRFTAERTPDGHSDRFWSLALANHAASGTDNSQWRPLNGAEQSGGNNPDANWIPA
jgi:phage FluMu gp28-like protein